MFEHHAERLANRLAPELELSERHRLLLGATFTQEVAVEAAAVCNPSAVPAPDQSGLAPGEVRVVLSVRQIGEGHRSTIGFRSVVVGPDGEVSIEPRGPYTTVGTDRGRRCSTPSAFADLADDVDGESVRWVLDGLGRALHDGPARRTAPPSWRPSRTRVATSRRRRRGWPSGRRAATPPGSRRRRGSTSGSWPRRARWSRTASRTPGSCASSTTDASRYHAYVHGVRRLERSGQQLLTTTDFETFTVGAAARSGRSRQGDGPVPPQDRRPLPRPVPMRRGAQRARRLRRHHRAGRRPTPLDVAATAWSSVQSATAVHRSSSTRAGWC